MFFQNTKAFKMLLFLITTTPEKWYVIASYYLIFYLYMLHIFNYFR